MGKRYHLTENIVDISNIKIGAVVYIIRYTSHSIYYKV